MSNLPPGLMGSNLPPGLTGSQVLANSACDSGLRSPDSKFRSRRGSSISSLSSITEIDASEFNFQRRGSAPEWAHIARFQQSRKSNQTLPYWNWAQSSRRGSYPVIRQGWDKSQVHIYGVSNESQERLCDILLSRRHSLRAGDRRWKESTMTMGRTTSIDPLNDQPFKFKIILLGDSGVGKSSFLQTLLNEKYTPSIANTNLTMANAVKTMPYWDVEAELHFCDTAGQERYRSITASYYRHAQGCLLFFNVNHKLSFSHVESWLDDLNKYCKRDNLAVVLVGLTHKYTQKPQQQDKPDTNESLQEDKTNSLEVNTNGDSINSRAVPRGQAEHLANNNSIPYMEVDIQNDLAMVNEITYMLLDLLMCRTVQNHQKVINIRPEVKKPSCVICLC